MSAPWFPFTERELAWAKRCKSKREIIVLTSSLLLAANVRHDAPRVSFERPMLRAEVDELAGYDARHTRLAFQQLELELGVRRVRRAHSNDRYAEFQLVLPLGRQTDQLDPGADGSAHGSIRSGRRIPVDPSAGGDTLSPDTDPDPSGRGARAHTRAYARRRPSSSGRSDGDLERLVWKLWPSQSKRFGREYIDEMRAHELAPSDAELGAFFRDVHLRPERWEMQTVRQPLAVLSPATSDRMVNFVRAYRRDRETIRDEVVPRVKPREQIAFAQKAMRSLRGAS